MSKHPIHSIVELTVRLANVPMGAKGTIVHSYDNDYDYEVEIEVGGLTTCITLNETQFKLI